MRIEAWVGLGGLAAAGFGGQGLAGDLVLEPPELDLARPIACGSVLRVELDELDRPPDSNRAPSARFPPGPGRSSPRRPCCGRPIYWLFIGEGPLRGRLEREIERLGLGDLVHLLGQSDHVAQFLVVSDIFVLGSRLEGMSNAILEAMAAGLPVIANAVGGNAELIEHEGTGVLCAPGDTDGLVHALLSLITDGDRRRALGARARERARRVFSLDIMISRYADFYRDLGMARGRRTGA